MAIRLTPCDPRRLRLLAEDRLPADEFDGLEEHLGRCDACRAVLDEMAAGGPWLGAARAYLAPDATDWREPGLSSMAGMKDVAAALAPSDWPDSIGRLGTYEVRGAIGRGGMGVVFKAFDPALHRNVAIKVLSPHLAGNGAARRRFLREARAAAAVAHEHVVAVYAVVESADPPFLAMEYIPGGSLQDRIDRHGPLTLPEILRIGMQTAAGLAAAHAQGLVHRDVKPANILLENGIERVKLTDFGLARAMADASMTQSGVVAGTPHYMAPEQARAEATDHRADLFSLGSTLYAMATGVPPFRAETPVAVVRRVVDDRPRPIRELNPEIPDWLEAIVDRLHAKDPADRFASASEVADLLGRCLAHVQEPTNAPLPPGLVASRPRGGTRVQRIGAAALLAVPLLVGLALASGFGRAPRDDRPATVVPAPVAIPPAADEEPFREIRERARALEIDLHRPADPPDEDRVSAIARDLAVRAEALARQLAPAGPRVPSPSALSVPQPR